MTRLFIPDDAASLSMGADKVAAAIKAEADQRGLTLEIIRNGSRGLFWLEPLVEVETARGRVAYGPVTAKDVV
jgi:formate dehydrogenase iron-sulfur subunit